MNTSDTPNDTNDTNPPSDPPARPNPSPQPPSDRQRLQSLLSIPERDRTDEQWDEINQLEISLAPGNRERGPDPNVRRTGPMGGNPSHMNSNPNQGGGRPGGGHPPGNRPQGKKPGKKFHRPKRPGQ